MMEEPLLAVDGLTIAFPGVPAPVVDDLSFAVAQGRTLGLVGESGCGKTMSALAILGLVPAPGLVRARAMRFAGSELTRLRAEEWRRLRGGQIALVSQDPLAALNPVHSVGSQVAEAIRLHEQVGRRAAWGRAVEVLAEVGLPNPTRRAHDYPHQLSGGQRQRVVIAMATCCRPRLLIADEPTTALDVSVQAQILDLLRRLQAEFSMAMLLITHDLGVIAEMADEVVVMRSGRLVERQPVESLFASPQQAYTQALLAAVPRLDGPRDRLAVIEEVDRETV